MTIATGVVEIISSKDVNITKGRMAGSVSTAYSFKLDDGNWYNNGFKKPPFSKGVTVEVVYTDGAYGREAKAVSVVSNGSSAGVADKSPSTVVPPQFPIPLRSKDRAIIRQNVLARAVEVYMEANKDKDPETVYDSPETVTTIISLARKFEEYCAGDIERVASEKLAGISTKED